MSKAFFWAGLTFFIGSIFLIVKKLDDFHVETTGVIVSMKIEKMPKPCLGAKAYYFVTLSYESDTYDKRIGGNFCEEHQVGEFINMKYLRGSSIVLFPDESIKSQFYSISILGLFGLVLAINQLRKMRKSTTSR